MSADAVSQNVEHCFCEIYQSEWKLTNLLNYQKKKLVTPSFSPLPNLDIKFCFEVWFSDYKNGASQYWLIKFILIKLDGSSIPSSAKLEIEMQVQHLGGTLIKEYSKLPIIVVKDMVNYYFDEIHLITKYSDGFSQSGCELNKDQTLVLKFRMIFSGHLQNLSTNCSSPMLCFLQSPKISANDIKSYKRADEFSDIIICVASKLFFAHKVILAHHSSVFKQMITQKPDREGILVTEDEMCDAFDSFLNYLYLGNFENTSWPMVRDVYILAAKYQVDTLKKKCSDVVVLNLSIDKICDILKMAYDYNDRNLKEISTKFAVDHIRDITLSEEWKALIGTHPLIGYDVTFRAFNIKNEIK